MKTQHPPQTAVQRLANFRNVRTGDMIEIPGLAAGRPNEVVVVLLAETPGFLGTGLLVRPPAAYDGNPSDERRALGLKLGEKLRLALGSAVSPLPAFAPCAGPWGVEPNVLRPEGHLVHFAAGPEPRRSFF